MTRILMNLFETNNRFSFRQKNNSNHVSVKFRQRHTAVYQATISNKRSSCGLTSEVNKKNHF